MGAGALSLAGPRAVESGVVELVVTVASLVGVLNRWNYQARAADGNNFLQQRRRLYTKFYGMDAIPLVRLLW